MSQFAHVVRCDATDKAIAEGTPLTAICGYTDSVANIKNIRNLTGDPDSDKVCIICATILTLVVGAARN